MMSRHAAAAVLHDLRCVLEAAMMRNFSKKTLLNPNVIFPLRFANNETDRAFKNYRVVISQPRSV